MLIRILFGFLLLFFIATITIFSLWRFTTSYAPSYLDFVAMTVALPRVCENMKNRFPASEYNESLCGVLENHFGGEK